MWQSSVVVGQEKLSCPRVTETEMASVGRNAVSLGKLRQASIPGQSEIILLISSLGKPQANGTEKGLLPLAVPRPQHFLLHLFKQAAPLPTSLDLLAAPHATGGWGEADWDCRMQ